VKYIRNHVSAEEIFQALGGKRTRDGYLCHCPAHADTNPSLHVKEKDGKILVHCFAGCTQDAVIEALRARGLWPENEDGDIGQPVGIPFAWKGKILTDWWAYTDANGQVIGYVARYDGNGEKEVIPFFNFDVDRGWRAGIPGQLKEQKLPLYNLPKILQNTDKIVVVCEGEKAADAAQKLLPEYVVTTSQGGSSAAKKSDWSVLAGRKVIVWPDADEAGIKYTQDVIRFAEKSGAEIIGIVDFEKLGFKLGSGKDAADLDKLDGDLPLIAVDDFKKRYAKDKKSQKETQQGEEKLTQAQILIAIAQSEQVEFFHNEVFDMFAFIRTEGKVLKIRSKHFKLYLTEKFFNITGKAPNTDSMSQALQYFEAISLKKRINVHYRIANVDGVFYYDLGNEAGEIVCITPQGYSVEKQEKPVFVRYTNTGEQVIPEDAEPDELFKLFNIIKLKSDADKILLAVYIVTALVPDIPKPVLCVHGEKGAGKSTLLRLLRALIDPAPDPLLTLRTKERDLALALAQNLCAYFDNVSYLSQQQSDFLCRASTGAALAVRQLYTDDEMQIFRTKCCVGISGIHLVANAPDLQDRTITIELERISPQDRVEESDIVQQFEKIRHRLVGAMFNALARAMVIKPFVRLSYTPRMADWAAWGYAVAEALGVGGDVFLKTYIKNTEKINEKLLETHPLASAILAFMEKREEFTGKPSELLDALSEVAETEKINIKAKSWPKSANVMTRRLREIKSNLEDAGIAIIFGKDSHGLRGRFISLQKVRHLTVETVAPSLLQESQPLTSDDMCDDTANGGLCIVAEGEACDDTVANERLTVASTVAGKSLKLQELDGSDDSDGKFPTSLENHNKCKKWGSFRSMKQTSVINERFVPARCRHCAYLSFHDDDEHVVAFCSALGVRFSILTSIRECQYFQQVSFSWR